MAAATPSPPPPLIGVVRGNSGWALRPLDPRTLAPLQRSWSQRVGSLTTVVRSPLGTGVVASWPGRTIYVDSRSGRGLRPPLRDGSAPDMYWFGGERFTVRGGAVVLAGYEDTGSLGGYWYTIEDLLMRIDDAADVAPYAVLPEGLVISDEGRLSLVRGMKSAGFDSGFAGQTPIRLPGLPAGQHFRVVADIIHDRLYVITPNGAIAQVDDVGRRPKASYHHVDLNGRPFGAAWAGQGRIALWGIDGLGTIDTRTWTTHAIDSEARAALATPYGIVAWSYGAAGVRVYRPDGILRFTVLADKIVQPQLVDGRIVPGWTPPIALGRYLYIIADRRMTVDLVTGRVVGPARADARLAQPSFVSIP